MSRVYTIRGTVASYRYNTDGIRIGKTVGEVQTDYLLDAAGTIQALEQGIQKLVFFYDSTGKREGFSYYIDNELEGHYYYLYNAQGDVRAILDSNFEAVVLYDYDSWGQPLSTTGELAETLGSLNPFRYRGYIYDEETGLYYLNSRYYDPVVGRFINADSVIAAAPAVAGLVATTACFYGASVATAGVLATATSVGCAGIAIGVVATGINRGVENITGVNYGAKVLGEYNYETLESTVNLAAMFITTVPQTSSYPSTGRNQPQNLNEQVGMRIATQYPNQGKVIIDYLNDGRMPGWLGWQKYQQSFGDTGVCIHYVGNKFFSFFFDFKFVK